MIEFFHVNRDELLKAMASHISAQNIELIPSERDNIVIMCSQYGNSMIPGLPILRVYTDVHVADIIKNESHINPYIPISTPLVEVIRTMNEDIEVTFTIEDDELKSVQINDEKSAAVIQF